MTPSERWPVRLCPEHGLVSPSGGGFQAGRCPVCYRDLGAPFSVMRAPEIDDEGLVSTRHGETAYRAMVRNRPKVGSQRGRVLTFIEDSGRYGATRDEISTGLGMSPNTVRPRVRELLDGAHVFVSRFLKRTTGLGNAAEVLVSSRFRDYHRES